MRNTNSILRAIAVICAFATPGFASAATDIYVSDKTSGCMVFRPNVQANEAVAWTGKCLGGMADGPGTAQWSIGGRPTVSFSGTFISGVLQGNGSMIAAGGDRYQGEYKDGMRDGKGIYVAASGERYEGVYKNNQRDGPGALIDAEGRRTDGIFQAGVMVSKQSAAVSASVPPAGPALSKSTPPTAIAAASSAVGMGGTARIGQETTTTSGAVLRIDECGGLYGGVLGVPPKSLDLKALTPSRTYSAVEASGGIFPIVHEAVEYYLSICKTRPGHRVTPPGRIFLFVDRLPAPGDIAKALAGDHAQFINIASGGGDSWHVQNGPSNFAKEQGARQRQQALAQQQQAQITSQRAQADERRSAFLRQHGAIEIRQMGILRSNPFSLEGKIVAIPVNFYKMFSSTVGRFEVLTYSLGDHGGQIVVSDIPKGTFLEPTSAFLAAKVLGLTPAQGSDGGEPHLKFVGVAICARQSTSCP